jgi:protein-serine/threonine kinase
MTLQMGGFPFQAGAQNIASNTEYLKFLECWKKFTVTHPDGLITRGDNGYPDVRPAFGTAKMEKLLPNTAIKRLILRMLHPDPKKRITIEEVLNDRVVKDIECCALDPRDDPTTRQAIDASGTHGCRAAKKMEITKQHKHLPPAHRKTGRFFIEMRPGQPRYEWG